MEKPTLIISTFAGRTSTAARCSACHETFPLSAQGQVDPLLGQRELKGVFEAHVKEKHTWRADTSQTAALRLRKFTEGIG